MLVPARRVLEPAEVAPNGVATTLVMDSSVSRGQALRIDIVWTNMADSLVAFTYGHDVPSSLIGFTDDGDHVWSSPADGMSVTSLGVDAELEPGEELRFIRYWELVDADGFALPRGEYLVQAQGSGSDHVNGRVRRLRLISEAYPLRIDP